jgi:hypothetical protein
MFGLIYRALLPVVFTFVFFAGMHNVALADCGKSAFATFSTAAHKVEAIPLTPATVLPVPGGANTNVRINATIAIQVPVSACPDEPAMLGKAYYDLSKLWSDAILTRNEIAKVSMARAGETMVSPACYGLLTANVRSSAAGGWAQLTGATLPKLDQDERPGFVAMQRLKDYPHVHALWLGIAHDLGMPLPPPGSEMTAWSNQYAAAASAAVAHLPTGVNCNIMWAKTTQ